MNRGKLGLGHPGNHGDDHQDNPEDVNNPRVPNNQRMLITKKYPLISLSFEQDQCDMWQSHSPLLWHRVLGNLHRGEI